MSTKTLQVADIQSIRRNTDSPVLPKHLKPRLMGNQSTDQVISSDRTRDLGIHEVLAVEKSCCCQSHRTMSRLVLTTSQRFMVLALMMFLNLSLTAANGTTCRAPASSTKRLAPKLSRVEIDVDYSSLLRPHKTQTQLQSAPYIPESQPCSPCSSSSLPAEESSSGEDLLSLRLRGGRVLPSHCSAACGESPLHARAPCSPSHYPSRSLR